MTQPGRLMSRCQVTDASAGTPRRRWRFRFGSPLVQSAESQMTRPDEETSELICTGECGKAYPVRDDIPVLLVDEARKPGAGA